MNGLLGGPLLATSILALVGGGLVVARYLRNTRMRQSVRLRRRRVLDPFGNPVPSQEAADPARRPS